MLIEKRIGRRIRQQREAMGLSRSDLADRCGLTRVSVYNTELGVHSVSVGHLAAIAKALGTTIAALTETP